MLEIYNCYNCAGNLQAFKISKQREYFVSFFLSDMGKTTWRKNNLSTNALVEFKKSVNLVKARQ